MTMRVAAVLTLVVLVSSCFERPRTGTSGPAVIRVGTSYELALPRRMVDAIQRALPGFEVETLDSYDADIQAGYRFTSRQAPWAVVADFDGDGVQDVVVDGHVDAVSRRLVVWGSTAEVDFAFDPPAGRRGEEFHSG